MAQKKNTICSFCAEVATFPGNVEPHDHMRIQSHTPISRGGYDITYRCTQCDTVWISHTDRWGFNSGFKLKPPAEK